MPRPTESLRPSRRSPRKGAKDADDVEFRRVHGAVGVLTISSRGAGLSQATGKPSPTSTPLILGRSEASRRRARMASSRPLLRLDAFAENREIEREFVRSPEKLSRHDVIWSGEQSRHARGFRRAAR